MKRMAFILLLPDASIVRWNVIFSFSPAVALTNLVRTGGPCPRSAASDTMFSIIQPRASVDLSDRLALRSRPRLVRLRPAAKLLTESLPSTRRLDQHLVTLGKSGQGFE